MSFSIWDISSSMEAVTGEERKRRLGMKTGNKDREPRLRNSTKNGEQRIRKDKDGEKEREIKCYPVSETNLPGSKKDHPVQ